MQSLDAAALSAKAKTPEPADLLRAAAEWVADGWPVFVRPLYLNGSGKVVKGGFTNCSDCPTDPQHPSHHQPEQCACTGLLCHAMHAATLDLDRFIVMLAAAVRRVRGGSQVGLSVRIPEGGLVLDVDRHAGSADGLEALGKLDALAADGKGETVRTAPETRMVVSAGGGFHFYYTGWDTDKAPSLLLPGLEVKTSGSSLVVPPSTTPLGAAYWEHYAQQGQRMAAIQPLTPRLKDLLQRKRTHDSAPRFANARRYDTAPRRDGDPLAAVMTALGDLGKEVRATAARGEWVAQCPAHADRRPSLVVMDKGERVTLHCRSGCDHTAVLAALNLRTSDLKASTAA